jgi:hypothetical protein
MNYDIPVSMHYMLILVLQHKIRVKTMARHYCGMIQTAATKNVANFDKPWPPQVCYEAAAVPPILKHPHQFAFWLSVSG